MKQLVYEIIKLEAVYTCSKVCSGVKEFKFHKHRILCTLRPTLKTLIFYVFVVI